MSTSSFKRKFKELYGLPPGTYIRTKRLEKAAQLLSSSPVRVTDVCFDSGLGDLSNFSKAFTKKYGISPLAYQKQHLA
ncbi:MAG: helix-turn-helix transcriptional regulator [Phaeodactylibacter sp.]|nr:helix-turn-helix transcriptional regulator [Phaeodactylibacter sp.]